MQVEEIVWGVQGKAPELNIKGGVAEWGLIWASRADFTSSAATDICKCEVLYKCIARFAVEVEDEREYF